MSVSDPLAGSQESIDAAPTVPSADGAHESGPWSRWLRSRLPEYGPPIYRRPYYLQVALFACVLGALGFMWQNDVYRLGVLTTALTLAIAAVGLYFAYSLGGLFAFSQGAFMGLGAYASARVAEHHSFVAGFLTAMVVTFVVAVLLGLILRRARHLYFAIGALAFAEVMVLLFRNWEFLGGTGSGVLYGIAPPKLGSYEFVSGKQVFWFMLGVTCLVLLTCALVERSPMRRNSLATKEIPNVAEASGVRIYRTSITLFGFGSTLAGIAGALTAHTVGSITPEAFEVGVAINLYLMILLGGLRSMWGAVVGAFFVVWLPELLRPVREYQTVIFSLLLLVTIIILPSGIVGSASKLTERLVKRAQGH